MLSNIGPVQLVIILVIVIAIFGTKKLRNMGGDLGSAVKGFRSAVKDADEEPRNLTDGKDADFESTPASESSSKQT